MTSRLVVTVEGTPLDDPFDVSLTDTANAFGAASFKLKNDDPQVSGIAINDLASISIDGVADAFWFVIESIKTIDIDGDEGAGQVTTYSGRQSACELERIRVYPALGLVPGVGQADGYMVARSPWSDDRLFGWPDPDRAGLLDQETNKSDNILQMTGTARPVGWPDVDSYFVGDSGGADVIYAAARIDPTDMDSDRVIVWVSFADEGELYWNGVLLVQVLGSEADRNKTHRVSLEVTPGELQILSVKVRKITATNAVFGCCVHQRGGTFPLLRTQGPGQDWTMTADPTVPPGISPGELIMQILDEATDRGLAHGWTVDFDAVEDSNGDPWPLIPIFPARVGQDSLADVLERLVEGWIDWAVLPGSDGRTLSAWNAEGVDLPGGGTGAGRGSASGVTVTVGSNALEVAHEVTV